MYFLGAYNRIFYLNHGEKAGESRLIAITKTRNEGHKIVSELNRLLDGVDPNDFEDQGLDAIERARKLRNTDKFNEIKEILKLSLEQYRELTDEEKNKIRDIMKREE